MRWRTGQHKLLFVAHRQTNHGATNETLLTNVVSQARQHTYVYSGRTHLKTVVVSPSCPPTNVGLLFYHSLSSVFFSQTPDDIKRRGGKQRGTGTFLAACLSFYSSESKFFGTLGIHFQSPSETIHYSG